MIFCDASKIGWGTHLDSIMIGGRWLKKEASSHTNFLELKAAFLAFQALVPSVKGPHICFGIYNHTAMSHINKLGGTRSQNLSNLAIELWNYALNRNLIISAIHIPGKLSVLADHKSRIFNDSIEWMLNPRIFRGVVARLGQPDIDLLASRVNHQILEFISWRPEPNTVTTDAFNLTWNHHLSYLFPPFSLIPLCLKKYREIKQNAFLLHQSGKADRGIQFFCQCCHTSLYCYLSPDFFFNSQERTRFTPSVHLAAWKV